MKTAKTIVIVPVILLAGFMGVWKLQHALDKQRARLREERDYVLLSSPKLIQAVSLEYAPLMADFYWTRVVQFYGNKHVRGDANLEQLWPLLDITTTLDPNLIVAYRFGAIFLSQRAPGGAGRPDLAVRLIERGIKENAKAHLQLLRALEDCKQLDLLGGEYEKRFGHRPRRVSELVEAGMLQGMAVDPLDYPYTFDENGKAALNPKSPLFEKQKFFERFK